MDNIRILNNYVLVKLDKENTSIKLKNGFELYVDDTFEPEKHATITGTVAKMPDRIHYHGVPNRGMPWKVNIELSVGDKVVFYYLSVINALKNDTQRYILHGDDRFVFIPYDKIYAVYGDGFVRPINGYVLVEPVTDPFIERLKERMKAIGMEAVIFQKKNNTHVTFAKVRYIGRPIIEYVDDNHSDEGVDISVGDIVVLRRTYDIPLEYELHSKIDKPSKLIKVQRRNILAKI